MSGYKHDVWSVYKDYITMYILRWFEIFLAYIINFYSAEEKLVDTRVLNLKNVKAQTHVLTVFGDNVSTKMSSRPKKN